jgi:hypothetical protein
MNREKTTAKLHGKLEYSIAFAVEEEILPYYGLFQDFSFCVIFHGMVFLADYCFR